MAPQVSRPRPTILVIDDDPDILLGLRVDLERFYDVATADSVATAKDQLRSTSLDAVVLDLGLPDGEGFEVMQAMLDGDSMTRPPVLVLSGRDEWEAPLQAEAVGAADYLSKPAESFTLRERIDRLLQKQQVLPTRVLVVEDDPDLREGLAVQLEAKGFEVLQAADGLGAVAMASKEQPDVMLLDLGLPAGDGNLVLHRLQERDDTANIPVIVVSAREPIDNANRVVQEGARMFLQKPVENDLLMRALETVL